MNKNKRICFEIKTKVRKLLQNALFTFTNNEWVKKKNNVSKWNIVVRVP